jgi:hypothetical protein
MQGHFAPVPDDRKRGEAGRSRSSVEMTDDRKRGEAGRSGSSVEMTDDRKRGEAGRSGSSVGIFVVEVLSWLIPQAISVMCRSCSTAASHCCAPR